MFFTNVKNKDYVQEIYKTFSPLNWLLKIMSLDCHGEKQRFTPYWTITRSAIPALIFGTVNFFTLYYKYTCFYKNLLISVQYTDMVQTVYDLFQYLVDLYFVYKYGSDVFYEYIKQYAYIDGMLGMVYYTNIRKRIVKVMTIMFVMWITSSMCDFIIWAIGFGLIDTAAFSVAYIYALIKILTNLHLTLNVMHIESRLRVMGDLIQECYCASSNSSARFEEAVTKKNWFYFNEKSKRSSSKLYPIKSIAFMNWFEVKWLSRCYLLLTEQVNYVNKLFGMRILLNSLSLLIDMVRLTNLSVRILIGSQHTGYDHGYYAATSTVLRSLTCVTMIVSLVYHCEDTYRQKERIISLVEHLIIDKTLDEKLLMAYSEFRNLIQSRPTNFHMANFMRLDYPLLVSIASVFVTYTIILIQSI